MPKNEGTAGQGRPNLGGTKTEPPKKQQPATYAELNIDKKDASRWQNMAKDSEITGTKTEPVIKEQPPTYKCGSFGCFWR